MIIIKNGDRQIYHPWNPALQLINPKLILEDNAAGSLTFKIYKDNLNYDSIRKLAPVLSVIRNDKIIFKGRVISDSKDFYNGKTVEVEGKLAFFNDSQMEPFEFAGKPEELFAMIIESHNSQVMDWQKFKVGVVTVSDPNDYIVRESENTINTWEALKTRCFNSPLGGHIRIRYEEDGDYLDWVADYETVSKQSIEFARNMIDLSTDVDATETYTAIRPIGAEVEGKKIDITSVNEGKNYLVNEEKAAEYGIIFAPVEESTWEDVTLPENLLKKAREKLYGVFATLRETYEIRAVDLNLTDEQIEALNICEHVSVVSRPHGINGNYLLSKAEIHITAPQNSMFYLGSSKRVLGDVSGKTVIQPVSIPKNISIFENDANYISLEKTEEMLVDYASTEQVTKIVHQAVETMTRGADGKSAYEIAKEVTGFEGTEAEWIVSLEGDPGKPGSPGKDGAAATIEVGEVETVSNEEQAQIWNVGTLNKAKLNFRIPMGSPGKGAVECLAALGGFSFGYTDDGKPGFREEGADTVTPFSSDGPGHPSGEGGVRSIHYLAFTGEGLTFSPSALSIADGSFTYPLSVTRNERTIGEGEIILS